MGASAKFGPIMESWRSMAAGARPVPSTGEGMRSDGSSPVAAPPSQAVAPAPQTAPARSTMPAVPAGVDWGMRVQRDEPGLGEILGLTQGARRPAGSAWDGGFKGGFR